MTRPATIRRIVLFTGLALAFLSPGGRHANAATRTAQHTLSNDFVQIAIAPGQGGAVTAMAHKKAANFPVIADKGAGIAGTGTFFVPVLTVEGTTVDLADVAMEAEAGSDSTITLRAKLDNLAPGLSFARTYQLARDESGFRWTDRIHNGGKEQVTVVLEVRSRYKADYPAYALQSWFGSDTLIQRVERKYPSKVNEAGVSLTSNSGHVFWRVIGPYGVGFLYQAASPRSAAHVRHEFPPKYPFSPKFSWSTSSTKVPPGESLTQTSAAMIDEAGAVGENPADLAKGDRILLKAEVRAAGEVGQPLPGVATLISARSRKVRLAIGPCFEGYGYVPIKLPPEKAEIVLEAGKPHCVSFDFVPSRKGVWLIEAAALGDKGERIASARAQTTIDGTGLGGKAEDVWKAYQRKIPHRQFSGSWREIGGQLAKAGLVRKSEADKGGAQRLAFYKEMFPYYAELLDGAAAALGVGPEKLALRENGLAPKEACMAILLNGPDGPVLAYTKERPDEGALGGLEYIKMIPTKGYKYHMYTLNTWDFGYGINSEGLATAGVAITCDKETDAKAKKLTKDWKQSGKLVAPIGMHMMLATCKNVEEAVQFIENPNAPFEFEGNMLLVDRSGKAVRLESVGLHRQIHRFDTNHKGLIAAVNYPHENANREFRPGPDWTWTANAQLRERRLESLLGDRKDRMTVADTIALLETHGTGGMCLHGCNNPAGFWTMNAYVAAPKTSELWLSHGNPCKSRMYRFDLTGEKR